jgi:hypothetical protein
MTRRFVTRCFERALLSAQCSRAGRDNAVLISSERLIMQSSDQDMVRRALSSILERLEGGAVSETEITSGANVNQSTADHHTRSRANVSGGSDNPIILIVLGQSNAVTDGSHILNAQAADARKDMRESLAPANLKSYEIEFTIDRRQMPSAHPGLERFPIAEAVTAPSAPKTCFMEPGRSCVNSGACEMRGY